MDFDLEFDEKERERRMTLNIDGLELDIPEELIEERIRLMNISFEEVQNLLTEQAKIYKENLIFNHLFCAKDFEQEFIKYIDNEISIYRVRGN